MTNKQKIEPHKVTKPIQLLAAWLVGLIVTNGSFLAAAAGIAEPTWVTPMLSIAAVVNVPVFLIAIFLLQTKFRPEMQEDSYYHEYLQSKTGGSPIEPVELDFSEQPGDIVVSPDSGELTTDPGKDKSTAPTAKLTAKWGHSEVAVNKGLEEFVQILAILKGHRIPVSRTFGFASGSPQPSLNIVVGPNVEFSEIKILVDALGGGFQGSIEFIWYELEPGEFDQLILIGAFGPPAGIDLAQAKQLIADDLLNEEQFMDLIGKADKPNAPQH